MARIEGRKKLKKFVDISLSFEPNPVTGDLTVLKNERAINNAIKNIVMTVPGEMAFNAEYGSRVSDYLFDLFDAGTAGMLNLEIRRAINYNEPRVELVDVLVQAQVDQNQFNVRIEYKIIGYEETFTLTHILTPSNH